MMSREQKLGLSSTHIRGIRDLRMPLHGCRLQEGPPVDRFAEDVMVFCRAQTYKSSRHPKP